MNFNKIFEALSYSVGSINPNWNLINKSLNDDLELNFDNQRGVKEFYKAAKAVIEPTLPDDLSEEYGEFCNTDKWGPTLFSNLDCFVGHDQENWIRVIKAVIINGY